MISQYGKNCYLGTSRVIIRRARKKKYIPYIGRRLLGNLTALARCECSSKAQLHDNILRRVQNIAGEPSHKTNRIMIETAYPAFHGCICKSAMISQGHDMSGGCSRPKCVDLYRLRMFIWGFHKWWYLKMVYDEKSHSNG